VTKTWIANKQTVLLLLIFTQIL